MTLPDLLILSPDGSAHLRGESQLNLKRFLYRGSASHRANLAMQIIDRGELGDPQLERLELLLAVKDEIMTRLVAGQSPNSVPHYIVTLTQFFQFLEEHQCSFGLEQLEANYLKYAEYLFIKSKSKKSTINARTAYIKASTLSSLFGQILSIPGTVRLVNRTRLRASPTARKAVSKTAEKQSLEATFKQGHFLVDLIAGLSIEEVYGSLPLTILDS